MKRESSLDLILRERATARAQGLTSFRHRREADDRGAGVGACPTSYEAIQVTADNCDLASLDRYYSMDAQSLFAVVGQAAPVALTMNPLDTYFCPVAAAVVVADATDPGLPRFARIYGVDIRGCPQLDFRNATPTVAATTQFIPSQVWDPANRNGCACPVNWGCYSNQGLGSDALTVTVGSDHPAGINLDFTILIWGVGFRCCPPWLDEKDFERRPDKPTIPGARTPPQPAGNIRAALTR